MDKLLVQSIIKLNYIHKSTLQEKLPQSFQQVKKKKKKNSPNK